MYIPLHQLLENGVIPPAPQTGKAPLLEVQWLSQVDSLGDLSACFAKEIKLSTVTGLIFHMHNCILSNSLPRLFLLETVLNCSAVSNGCYVSSWGIWMILLLPLAFLVLSFSPISPD